ncbi:MAG: hypothetical protein AAGG08_06575 [Actinomycetota bacterium]
MTDQQHATDSNVAQADQIVVDEALSVIDGALAKMMQRELVSSGEVADLLLDVRTLLTESSTASSAQITEIQPVTTES